MRERIHGGIVPAEPILLRVAVPAFPNRSGPLVDLVAPRREFVALQEEYCEIILAGQREYR